MLYSSSMRPTAPSTAFLNAELTSENVALELKVQALLKELREVKQEKAALTDQVSQLQQVVGDLESHLRRLLRAGGKLAPTLAAGQGLLFLEQEGGIAAAIESLIESKVGAIATITPEDQKVQDAEEGEGDGECDGEGEGDAEAELQKPSHKNKKPARRGNANRARRQIDQANLRREVKRIELPPELRRCPVTGLMLVENGYKSTTELHLRPSELVVLENQIVTYGPSPEIAAERKIGTISAPNPIPAVRGAAATASLLAHLLNDKYVKHLPLYRQVDAFAALGVHISRKTLCDWVLLSALELTPVAEQIAREVLAGPVVQLDDTPIRVKRPGPGGNKQKYRQSSLWVLTNPSQSGVVFRFTEGRSAKDVSSILGTVDHASQIEVVLGDGYGGNRAGAIAAGLEVDFAGCWAHLLRKFRDALIEAPAAMGMFLKDIANLYAIEARAQSECHNAEARLQLRRRESFPIVRSLMRLTSGWQKTYSLKGRVAEAMKYTRNQRRALLMFLRDGRVPIDNNVCERAIRPVAIGRKNWLFAGSVSGARAAAVLYTLVESAKATGVDPRAYLEAVLSRANQTHPSKLHELTPWHLAIELPAYERQGS